jgi:hypothetical protein
VDRLDGKITEGFWEAKSAEWQQEEQTILASLRELERAANPERVLDRVRILELANKAHSLYVTQTPAEKAKLLRMVLSNCAVDAVSVYPTIAILDSYHRFALAAFKFAYRQIIWDFCDPLGFEPTE